MRRIISAMNILENESWKKIELLNKGWSSDKKYYVEDKNDSKYLLRVSDISELDIKRKDFNLTKKIANQGVKMSIPVDFGTFDKNSVYMLFSWVEGEDLENVLSQYNNKKKYDLGYQAGIILKKIHECKISEEMMDWSVKFNKKIDRNIKTYSDCPIKYDGAEKIINYINNNRYLLDGRPQVLQHGDFHPGNMIINNNEISIVDFNRMGVGDPWEEFNRITFSAILSGEFASGMINGYFNNCVPNDFFKLMALYVGCSQLSSISWAVSFGEDEVAYMVNQAQLVLEWYMDYTSIIPTWYIAV
jgi:serine/threonine-protein kinase